MDGIFQTVSTGGNTFSIAPYSFAPRSTLVHINGLYQQWGIDYTENTGGQQITTVAPIQNGFTVEIRYEII
jgi:hypothetical protein